MARKKRAKSRFCSIIYEPHTKCVHFKQARVLARITSKIKEFIQYYGFTKATHRDEKMKKSGEFWRENAVGIGLYNQCVMNGFSFSIGLDGGNFNDCFYYDKDTKKTSIQVHDL